MAIGSVWCAALAMVAAAACPSAFALEEIQKHQAKKIADAAPAKKRQLARRGVLAVQTGRQ